MKAATKPSLSVPSLKMYITNIATKKEGTRSRYTGESKLMAIANRKPETPAFMLGSIFQTSIVFTSCDFDAISIIGTYDRIGQ
jgi:hypothetical protein